MSTDDVSKANPNDRGVTDVEDMSLLSITDGENDRGIPLVKFIENVDEFANSFAPPSSAELLIGAYSELHSKFKTFETSLTQKSTSCNVIAVYLLVGFMADFAINLRYQIEKILSYFLPIKNKITT